MQWDRCDVLEKSTSIVTGPSNKSVRTTFNPSQSRRHNVDGVINGWLADRLDTSLILRQCAAEQRSVSSENTDAMASIWTAVF